MNGYRIALTHCLGVATTNITTQFTQVILWQHFVIKFRGAIVILDHRGLGCGRTLRKLDLDADLLAQIDYFAGEVGHAYDWGSNH